jgi:hypothetical protein
MRKKINLNVLIENEGFFEALYDINNLTIQIKLFLFQLVIISFNSYLFFYSKQHISIFILCLLTGIINIYLVINSYLKNRKYYNSNIKVQGEMKVFFKTFFLNRFYKKADTKIMTAINSVLLNDNIKLYKDSLIKHDNRFFNFKIFRSLEKNYKLLNNENLKGLSDTYDSFTFYFEEETKNEIEKEIINRLHNKIKVF